MATIVTRAGKGSPLTHNEVDANFTNLNTDKIESGDTVASLTVTSADINGGTIDGTVIGGSTPAAISGTTGSFSGNLTVDTNTLFVNAANNRVGIGTSSPSTQLEVVGTIRASGGGPILSILDTGGATDEKEWTLRGADGPLRLVAINEAGAGSGDFVDFTRVGNSVRTIRGARSGVTSYELSNFDRSLFFSGGVSTIGTATAHDLVVNTNNTERMRITATGNVGIGTSSPSEKLDVRGAGTTTIGVRTTDTSGANVGRVRVDYTGGGGGVASQVDLRAGDAYTYLVSPTNTPMLFGTNNTEAMRITNTGSVGIGTNSPGSTRLMAVASSAYSAAIQATSDSSALNWARLDVKNQNATDPIILYQDQAGNGFLRNNTTTGMFAFQTGGSNERMRITATGSVGIGTSSPVSTLHIEANPANITLRDLDAPSNGYVQFGARGGSGEIGIIDVDPNDVVANSFFAVNVDGTERMRITSTGNVGIGTSSPETVLHTQTNAANTAMFNNSVAGLGTVVTRNTDTSGIPGFALRSWSTWTSPKDTGQIRFDGLTSTGAYTEYGSIYLSSSTNTSTGAASTMKFSTSDGTASAVERMRINSAGLVGIGTSAPQASLDVRGYAQFGPIDTALQFQGISLVNGRDSSVSGTVSFIDSKNNLNVTDSHIFMEHVTDGGSVILFGTTPPGDRTVDRRQERMRITPSGNLLVGTTAWSSTSNGIQIGPSSNSRILITNSADYGLELYGATTNRVSFYTSAGGATRVGTITVSTTATAYNTSSDYRLKEDVQPMVGSSDRLMALKPVNFAWKADGTRVDGFLAHEVQALVPEAVTGEKDAVDADGNPVHQGIDQSKLVPLLTAALQEALQKIEALEARITALEAQP